MKAEERMIGDDLAETMHPFECFKKELEKRRFYMLQEAIALLRDLLEAAAWLGEHGHTFPPEFQEKCLKAQRYLEGGDEG